MIINDILSGDDLSAISLAHEPEELPYFNLNDLEELSHTLNQRDRHFFECLAWLIRNNRIELKIIRMINGAGIAHTKCGTFSDGKNTIAFDGSVNFSLSALLHNKESLSVNCDWNGTADIARIRDIQNSFDRVFNGVADDVEFVDPSKLVDHIVSSCKNKSLPDLLKDELELIDNNNSYAIPISKNITKVLSKAKERVLLTIKNIRESGNTFDTDPSFPFPDGPRTYQQDAFNKWKHNNQKGLFAMATGTGKTVTALNCLLEIYNRLGYYKALILVPTIALVNQWAIECSKFNFHNVIKIYSQSSSWKKDVADIEILEKLNEGDSAINYILICTYSSFAKKSVHSNLFGFPKGKVLLIADEAHNMGSPQLCKLLPHIPYARRIGLSATPNRQFDVNGNRKISEFFGFTGNDYTFCYSMKEAIDRGVLCRYYYYPHIVHLTQTEFEAYFDLSNKIAKYLNNKGTDFKSDPLLTALLIKRKRIVHKAKNKLSKFREILESHYALRKSLRYTLIYVPEGSTSDTEEFVYADQVPDDADSLHLIDLYTSVVRDINPTVTVSQFTAESKDRNELLEGFSNGSIDVLTSMKCLDEGVDVPRSELAIFCASTGNPRQFIQRRGRILRTHKDKPYAVIHDLIVAPIVSCESRAYNVERNLLNSELNRVKDFSSLSENPTTTLMELTPILNHYNLNMYENG